MSGPVLGFIGDLQRDLHVDVTLVVSTRSKNGSELHT
jgi:hypothetical protein